MDIKSVVEAFSHGELPRREALRRLMAAGLRASAAYAALGLLPSAEADAVSSGTKLGSADLKKQFAQIEALATNPQILAELQKLDSLAPEQKSAEAQRFVATYSNPANISALGLQAEGQRIALRIFEAPTQAGGGETVLAQTQTNNPALSAMVAAGTTVCGSVGYVACVSIGKEL